MEFSLCYAVCPQFSQRKAGFLAGEEGDPRNGIQDRMAEKFKCQAVKLARKPTSVGIATTQMLPLVVGWIVSVQTSCVKVLSPTPGGWLCSELGPLKCWLKLSEVSRDRPQPSMTGAFARREDEVIDIHEDIRRGHGIHTKIQDISQQEVTWDFSPSLPES